MRGGIVHDSAQALGEQPTVAVGREVEDQAAGDGRQRHHQENPGHQRARQVYLLLGPLGRRHLLARRDEREDHGARQRDGAWHREGGAPAHVLDQEAGEDRGAGDAEIAGQAVDADREPGILRLLHEHRDAHRMVDGREHAHQRQRGRQRPYAAGQRDQQRGDAHAQEEDDHHRAPAPQITQAAGRQRAEAEHDERPGGVRHQIGPHHPPVGGDGRDRGGEDQQEQMVQAVADVEEERGRGSERRTGRGVHGGATVAHRLAACQTRCLPVVAGTSWP